MTTNHSQHKKALSLIPLLDEGEPLGPRGPSPVGSPFAGQQHTISSRHRCREDGAQSGSPSRLGYPLAPKASMKNPAASMSRHPSASLGSLGPPGLLDPPDTSSQVVSCTVDNRTASVTCTNESVFINYASPAPWACVSCLPSSISPSSRQRLSEDVPYAEILSARSYVSKGPVSTSSWLSSAKPGEAYEIELYTFMRSRSNRSLWVPRIVTVSSLDRGLIERCLCEIRRRMGSNPQRPKSLLVLINPYGGSRKAAAVYEREVKPVFEKAGIRTTVRTTRYSGDAKETVCRVFGGYGRITTANGTAERTARAGDVRDAHEDAKVADSAAATHDDIADIADIADLSGIVAVGGDGLFHEVVAGLLKVDMQHRIRVAHVAAGSTDSVASTLNGTRSAFTAAMHVALGDNVALDVLRLDTERETKFAMSMASWGFFGNVMEESEKVRWLGPMRYDLVGARMWLLNRSYPARIEFLSAPPETSASQIVCTKDCPVCSQPSHSRLNPARKSFKLHAQESRMRFASDWQVVEGEFAGVMMVIIPCRSDKSKAGVCKYSHLSDGRIHLVMIKACSRWRYLQFLLRLSKEGLESGSSEDGIVRVEPCVAVKVTHAVRNASNDANVGGNVWNVDGELVEAGSVLHAEVHRRVIEAFSRGVEE